MNTLLVAVIVTIIVYLCMIRLACMNSPDGVSYVIPLTVLFIVGFIVTRVLLTYVSYTPSYDHLEEYVKEEVATNEKNSTPIVKSHHCGSFVVSYKGADRYINLNGSAASYVNDGIIILDDGRVYGNGDRLEDVAQLKERYHLDTKKYYDYTKESLSVIPLMSTQPSDKEVVKSEPIEESS